MPLGWIDFSKKERSRVLTVLDRLKEPGILDELGFSPIRDGFANRFFPGTSTIQTRAKYFLTVPYIMKDLERGSQTKNLAGLADEEERECCRKLMEKDPGGTGIIGERSEKSGRWVKRTPAEIYWAGLRQFGIFVRKLSPGEYFKVLETQKKRKEMDLHSGKCADLKDESEKDDADAANGGYFQFWNIPTYTPEWMENLSMKLTQQEATFLKEQILRSFPDCLFARMLQHFTKEQVKAAENFSKITGVGVPLPDGTQREYDLAKQFSDFVCAAYTVYNVMVSGGRNEKANERFADVRKKAGEISRLPAEEIAALLHIADARLMRFLNSAKACLQREDFEGLKTLICCREVQVKTKARARTCHPGKFGGDVWFGGEGLNYRYLTARQIMLDIFDAETADADPRQ